MPSDKTPYRVATLAPMEEVPALEIDLAEQREVLAELFSTSSLGHTGAGKQFRQIIKAIRCPVPEQALRNLDYSLSKTDLAQLRTGILLVYGEKDPDKENSLTYYRKHLSSANLAVVQHVVVPGADSGFYSLASHRRVLAIVEEWWQSQRS
jgi:hypothetical protein